MTTLRSFIDTVRQKISGLDYAADAYLNYANSVTGAEDTNVGDAIMSLAAGYGGGGGLPGLPSNVEMQIHEMHGESQFTVQSSNGRNIIFCSAIPVEILTGEDVDLTAPNAVGYLGKGTSNVPSGQRCYTASNPVVSANYFGALTPAVTLSPTVTMTTGSKNFYFGHGKYLFTIITDLED